MSETPSTDNQLISQCYNGSPKLRAAILLILQRVPGKLNRISLCKNLFYADGHFFQKYGRLITEHNYLHVEDAPQPMHFNELLHVMRLKNEIEITPQVASEIVEGQQIMVLRGLIFQAKIDPPEIFDRQELKVLHSVSTTLQNEMNLETRYFPNLYQIYVQTGLFEIIPNMRFTGGRRPHLQWKAWARKVYRLMWQ